MNRRAVMWAMVLFAVAGLLVSAYLTYLSLLPPTSCPVGEFSVFSCNEVIYSEYAHLYGVSVALLGLGWFVVTLGLIALAWRHQRFMWAVVGWSLLGAAGVAGFVYAEIVLLGSVCLLCTAAHVAGLAILALSVVYVRAPSEKAV